MPSFRYELLCEGRVAGIDEAGRGPLAGPVVAAVAVGEIRPDIGFLDGAAAGKDFCAHKREFTHARRRPGHLASLAARAGVTGRAFSS